MLLVAPWPANLSTDDTPAVLSSPPRAGDILSVRDTGRLDLLAARAAWATLLLLEIDDDSSARDEGDANGVFEVGEGLSAFAATGWRAWRRREAAELPTMLPVDILSVLAAENDSPPDLMCPLS